MTVLDDRFNYYFRLELLLSTINWTIIKKIRQRQGSGYCVFLPDIGDNVLINLWFSI